MKSLFFPVLWFFILAFVGLRIGLNSWGGHVALTSFNPSLDGRIPATVGKVFDLSAYSGSDLLAHSQARLVKAARGVQKEGHVGVELGHFVTKDADGQKQLACQFYNMVELIFQAEGVAHSGDIPIMAVEGPCVISDDVNRIQPLWIPLEKILETEPGNHSLVFLEESVVEIHFENMVENFTDWPKTWVLISLRLFHNSRDDRELLVSHEKLLDLSGQPLTLFWDF